MTQELNYNNNGYIINAFPHKDDLEWSIDNTKQWKELLNELVREDIEQRDEEEVSMKENRRYILNSDSIQIVANDVARKTLLESSQQKQSQTLNLIKDSMTKHLFIVRIISDTECRYSKEAADFIDDMTYDQDEPCEYYVYADSGYSRRKQNWKKLENKIQTIISKSGMRASNDTQSQLFGLLDEDELCVPTVNISTFENMKVITDEGFDIETHFLDGTYHHASRTIRDSEPSDFIEILGKRKFPLKKALSNDERYAEMKEHLDRYYDNISNHVPKRAELLKQVHLTTLLAWKPDMKSINIQGLAGTGKSEYVNLARTLAGKNNIGSATYRDMQDASTLEKIKNKSLIMSSDDDDADNTISQTGNIKKLLIGEDVYYVPKYKSQQSMNARNSTIIQAYNVSPKFITKTNNTALIERMKLVVFENKFRDTSQQDQIMINNIRDNKNLPYIARYLLEEIKPFKKYTDSGDELVLKEQIDDNPLVDFIEDLRKNHLLNLPIIPITDLFYRYEYWFEHENPGGKILSLRAFSASITELLAEYRYKRNNIRKTTNSLQKDGLIQYDFYQVLMQHADFDINDTSIDKAKAKQNILVRSDINVETNHLYQKVIDKNYDKTDLIYCLYHYYLIKNQSMTQLYQISSQDIALLNDNDVDLEDILESIETLKSKTD